MKKILWFVLALAMIITFVACEEEGVPAYVGTWYTLSDDTYTVEKIELTEDTFITSERYCYDDEYSNDAKGTISITSDGEGIITITHDWVDGTWVENGTELPFTYTLSSDGSTLTFVTDATSLDAGIITEIYSDTELTPVDQPV